MTVSLLPATLGNVEGEAALIGALMIENSLVELVTDLVSPADFYAPVHGRIYAAIVGDVLPEHTDMLRVVRERRCYRMPLAVLRLGS